ncbi:efflux RND transporter periplasmic adaptor subunit [Pontiellaceae bacterium B12227]|nr:efflux RND transporter periplasmic adaptor subunit [Pontiellaceae bacterium B12227]
MKLNKRLITGIGGVVLAVAVIILVSAAGAKKKEAAKHETEKKMEHNRSPRPVRFEKVQSSPLGRQRRFPGIVKASEESALSFRVGGPLTEVNVVLGEPVKQGDLLMQIDPRDFKDRIHSLEAQLAGAVARQQNAKQDFTRIAELFKGKVVPQADYDRAKSTVDSAVAAVQNINVQLDIARHALADTSLRAPYDGTVTGQLVENHEMVRAGTVVLSYHNIQTLEIIVHIPENEVANAAADAIGTEVAVTFPALRGQSFTARLKEWSTKADPLTRTYSSTFELQAPKGVHILPGMTANVDLSTAQEQIMVLTVPVSALVPGGRLGSSVWVYNEEGGKAELRSVATGPLHGASRVVITEGLAEGELVVVTGSRLIHEDLSLKTASVQ